MVSSSPAIGVVLDFLHEGFVVALLHSRFTFAEVILFLILEIKEENSEVFAELLLWNDVDLEKQSFKVKLE